MKVFTGREGEWNIEFIYSPMFEMLCSLHVLLEPAHHLERLEWAEKMKDRLPEKLYNSLMEYGKKTCKWCVIMDLCNTHGECDDFNIMSALDYIADLPMKDFEGAFSKYKWHGEMDFNEECKKKMVRILKEYYLTYFERELRLIEPLLVRCLKKGSECSQRTGIFDYIKGLHSRIEVTDKAFLFHKYTLFTIPFDSLKRIIIRVSSFIDPHLLMDYGDGMVQFTIRAHFDKGVDEVPKDLLRIMKALADETRLKMLKIIYKQKSSTQSLACELNLTEACISKHLKTLYDADLLYRERGGSYIYYYLNASLLELIPLNINEYLN